MKRILIDVQCFSFYESLIVRSVLEAKEQSNPKITEQDR